MSKKFEQKFEKWETKKRKQIGDKDFFKKYISMYTSLDKLNKIIFPFVAIMCGLLMVWRVIVCFKNCTFGNLSFAFVSFMLMATWIFLTQMYFIYISYGMYGKRIEKWKSEQEKQNNPQN